MDAEVRLVDEAHLWIFEPSVGVTRLVALAADLVAAGSASDSVNELASLYGDADYWDAVGPVQRVVTELTGSPLPEVDLHSRALVALCRRLLDGEMTGRDLTRWVHQNFGHQGSELSEKLAEFDDDFDILDYDGMNRATPGVVALERRIENTAREVIAAAGRS